MLQKMVLNKDYGVVELSDIALKQLGIESISEIERTDARLVGLFENGDEEELSGDTSRLQLVDIEMESDMDYLIVEHDGLETVVVGRDLMDFRYNFSYVVESALFTGIERYYRVRTNFDLCRYSATCCYGHKLEHFRLNFDKIQELLREFDITEDMII